MNKILLDDLHRYEGDRSKKLLTQLQYLLFTPGFQYTFYLRKANNAKSIFARLFWNFMLRRCMFCTGIQIPAGTEIGAGLRISHFGNIVINPKVRIGKNFSIAQGALIGSAEGKRRGVPTIGNNVIMSANSVVIGDVTIGDNVLIAPGAFVNFDVPNNSIVLGNPGQIISRDSSPTEKYNVYTVE